MVIDGRTSIYFPFADRDLTVAGLYGRTLDAKTLQLYISFYLLFYENLVFPDGASIYNPALRELTMTIKNSNYGLRNLLESGNLVWSQRSNAPGFLVLDDFMKQTGSWHPSDSHQHQEYLQFLDSAVAVRLPYAYQHTAELFTELTEVCLTDRELRSELRLDSVADKALQHSERWRLQTEDQFARRTAIYDFATKLERAGATRKARGLRQLSSTLYHASAAHQLGLNVAYPEQYRAALKALYGTPLPSWALTGTRHPAVLRLTDIEDVPFYSKAIELLTSDVLLDIRKTHQFKTYLNALRQCMDSPDSHRGAAEFRDALRDYVMFLDQPLGSLLIGKYSRWKRYRRLARLTRFTAAAGSIGVSIASVVDPAVGLDATVFSAVWGFGGWQITRWLGRQAVKQSREIDSTTGWRPELVTLNSPRIVAE